ncbi:MAG: aldehyde dehydrogenase family protein, partial [Acidobacteriaceae bacterium]|nr:aldehyde dehydrogenase family protein [Acidobacteriaceae bacterium]
MATALLYPFYIGGEWVDTDVHDVVRLPFDGSPVAEVPRGNADVVDRAVRAAVEGARSMASLANFERADLLLRIAEYLRRDSAEFAQLISSETGKPIREAKVEADRAPQTLLAAAHEARQLRGEVVPMDFAPGGQGRMALTVREPIGVIGSITPFNVPLNLALHKVAPAFAAGNAVVHKPAERTPLSALRLARTIAEAGAPNGAYNVITGDGPELAGAMLRHRDIAMITFTGSMQVGADVRAKAGLKRVLLELGNNSAVIVEPDADLKTAIQRTVQGAFAHSGQVCISVQRAFVHSSVMGTFLDGLQSQTAKLRVGHPYEEATDISSLIDENAAIRVESWI